MELASLFAAHDTAPGTRWVATVYGQPAVSRTTLSHRGPTQRLCQAPLGSSWTWLRERGGSLVAKHAAAEVGT